jgi:hypothetical protein
MQIGDNQVVQHLESMPQGLQRLNRQKVPR